MGQKILVIRMDHLGDVVLTTPLVRALALAGNDVQVIVPKAFLPVFEHSPRVSAAWSMEEVCPGFPDAWRPLARWIRAQRFDAVLLPYAREKKLLWASFCSGAKTRIAMWSGVWGRLTLHRCLSSRMLEEPRYFGDIVLDCARAMEIPLQGTEPELFLTGAEITRVKAMLSARFGSRRLVGIHPGCAGNACNLPPLDYGRLAETVLAETDCAVVLTGSGKERALLATWPAEVLENARLWNSMGELSLRELAALISQLSVYVCPSTGPLHLAAALKTPTVSAFCSLKNLSAEVWGNRGGGPASVLAPPLEFCLNRRKAERAHCDFCGQIDRVALARAVRSHLPPVASDGSAR